MSNTPDAFAQFFKAAGISDPIDQAYILRNPDVAKLVPILGATTAKQHYQNFGQKEGRAWGLNTAAPAAAVDPAVEAAKRAPPALPSSYGTDQASWDNFMAQSRMATEGVNRMPGVFSAYGAIPSDPSYASEVFYPKGVSQSGQSAQTNPLLAGAMGASAVATPAMAQPSTARPATGVATTQGVQSSSAGMNPLLAGAMMAGQPQGMTILADGTPMYPEGYKQPAPWSPQWAQGNQSADEWAARQAFLTARGISPYDE